MEVFIDGGIRRGTDVLKAICLRVSAVCLVRPFFYTVSYGQDGVGHALDSEFHCVILNYIHLLTGNTVVMKDDHANGRHHITQSGAPRVAEHRRARSTGHALRQPSMGKKD